MEICIEEEPVNPFSLVSIDTKGKELVIKSTDEATEEEEEEDNTLINEAEEPNFNDPRLQEEVTKFTHKIFTFQNELKGKSIRKNLRKIKPLLDSTKYDIEQLQEQDQTILVEAFKNKMTIYIQI